MKRAIAATAVVLLGLTLAGCHDKAEDPIDRGIRCAQAGGDWVWSDWTGYHCNITHENGEKNV